MKKLIWVLVLVCGVMGARADEFTQLTQNFKNYILGRAQRVSRRFESNQKALELARTLRPDGSWADVNYKDDTRGSWQPYGHLTRLNTMVRDYRTPSTGVAGNAELKAGIHKALTHWLRADYQCPNWWYNVIGVPQVIGQVGLLMQDELTPEEYELTVNRILPRAKIGMTGQNRVWVASNTLVRGLMMKDAAIVREAAGVLGEEIRVTTKEGVQPDFSFHQHGPQQQFGNYGLSFASSAAMWLRVFGGTPFEFSREKLDIVHDYLVQGEGWVVWRGRMDLSSCDRQINEGCQADKGRGVARAMEVMSQVDAARAGDYQAFLKRNGGGAGEDVRAARNENDLIGNRHFWRSDYMIQRGKDYYASVKMASRRVIGGEVVNSENVSGYHLADGALLVMRGGTEYEDIQPAWDWQKIPGTTAPQRASAPRLSKRYTLDTDFVGGVSDGRMGCAAMDFTRDGLRAKKAWFFVGDSLADARATASADARATASDAIVCLGAGITAEKINDPVVTTVNQCLLKGEVWAGDGKGERKLERGEHNLRGPAWVWHDGIGYVFPEGTQVTLRTGEQRGSWRKVEEKPFVSKKEIARDVFLLTIDHTAAMRSGDGGAGYAYTILPGCTREGARAEARTPNARVLANTAALQAVKARGAVQAVFYQAGALDYGEEKKLAVDQPCLALLAAQARGCLLTLADPTQKVKRITLGLDDRAVDLPQGGEAGKSLTIGMMERGMSAR